MTAADAEQIENEAQSERAAELIVTGLLLAHAALARTFGADVIAASTMLLVFRGVDARAVASRHPPPAGEPAYAHVAGRHGIYRDRTAAPASPAMRNTAFEVDAFAAAASSGAGAVDQALAVRAYLAGLALAATGAAMIGARSQLHAIAIAYLEPVRAGDAARSFRAGRRAERRGWTPVATGAAIERVVSRILAGLPAALIPGVTVEVTAPVARGFAM